MRIWVLALTAAIVVVGWATDGWARQKTDPTPDWRCRVVLRDAGSDKIRSDLGGSYTDGGGGVTCYIVNEPGATHHRWLFMSITGTRRIPPTRFVQFRGQTFEGASYPDFANHGTFEVKGLANVVWNPALPTFRDVMPFRAYLRHPVLPFAQGLGTVNGDSNFTGGDPSHPTSSVFVQPLDDCSWQITSHTTEEPDLFIGLFGERAGTRTSPRVMRISEGSNKQAGTVGDFPMAFGATVTVIGNKAGCLP